MPPRSRMRSIPLGEETNLRVSLKTVIAVLGAFGLAVYAWANIKGDVSDHSKQLTVLSSQAAAIETKVTEHERILIRMDAKMDFLVGGRRGPQPASGTVPSLSP